MEKIGIMGGSGLYDIETLRDKKWKRVATPFGDPSDELLLATCAGKEVVFLPRHGRKHTIGPSHINYKANIYAMKTLGVTRILSVTACGSLKKEYKPLDFVIPDQFVDRTNQARNYTFFEEGIVAHVSFAHPVCEELTRILGAACEKTGVTAHRKGTYLNMEGPQFSTLAESQLYRAWGMDIIGMTNMAEARLAREAQICYATLAAVTDYDCWHATEEEVSVEAVLENLRKNIANSKKILTEFIESMPQIHACSCHEALKFAIVTPSGAVTRELKEKLKPIIGDY